MTDDEPMLPRWLIQPEPTTDEFVALLSALRPTVAIEPSNEALPESHWARIARREQLRVALDDTGNGWNR